jgi:hypothetical protein
MEEYLQMHKRRFIIAVIIPLLLILVSHCGNGEIASDDIIGVWKTSEPTYADRSFEITKERITFGIGDGKFESYSIKKIRVEQSPQDKGRLYTIYYEDGEGGDVTFSFYYYLDNGGIIRLKNKKQMEWKKERGKR